MAAFTPSYTRTKKSRDDLFSNEVGEKGLKVARIFTKPGHDPYEGILFESRTSRITNPDGSTVFEMKDLEVPSTWSQVATDILAQKYFRKKGVPQLDRKTGEPLKNEDGTPMLGSEWSSKQVMYRLAGTWRHWGEKYGYFETKDDADAFQAELEYMLMNQYAAPNSPQWFNTGLHFAYGIEGNSQGHFYVEEKTGKLERSKDAYTRPQPHACFIQSISDDLVNKGGIFDGVMREARLFKYGSGTGSNFSKLRGRTECLDGGGKSSGLMSFLGIFDKAAGAIKSGGTTRRAAKMVCVDLDHPEIEDFIQWKVTEEQKVAALVAGSHICYEKLKAIVESVAAKTSNPEKNMELKKLILEAHKAHIPLNTVKRVIMMVENGMKPEDFDFRKYDVDFRSEAYATVGGQNSNNSIRITNAFLEAVEKDGTWDLVNRIDGKVCKTLKARDLWEDIGRAAWTCADPGVQYDTTINEWHTCPKDGRINASNPCSEYMFLDDTACNLASLNLVKFYDTKTEEFLIENFQHACRLWTMVLEISVLMAQFPSESIAQLSYDYRTLGLGYANIGTLLMRQGIPYDSEEAMAICGAITSLMCGESYATSAELAKVRGAFPRYKDNSEDMLRVIRNHRRAAYRVSDAEYENLSIRPMGINAKHCPKDLLESARDSWDRALSWGEKNGFRNAQVTVIAPTGTIGLLMDCDTTGIEPDFALVKFKKLVGGGYFKIANQSLAPALKRLGYDAQQIEDILHYVKGHGTLAGSPAVTHEELRAKGFSDKQILAVEGQLATAFELKFAFNKWTLGEDFCQEILRLTPEQIKNTQFDFLKHLGFSIEEIEKANQFVCGTMTIEGAPHLKEEDYPVFDCANRCGKIGKRFIRPEGHIRMMAAAQPFISGAISKTINLPEEATFDDIRNVYMKSWKSMLKANALYRDASKLSQPLNTSSMSGNLATLFDFRDEELEAGPQEVHQIVVEKLIQKPFRRKLQNERRSITHKFSIQGHEGYLTVGLYDDGQPGEIFIKMSKEGSTLSGIMDAFALSVSLNLQYGVPLEVLVGKFTHSRFEPAGMTQNQEIPMVKSLMDYLGRWMALKFLPRETAKKYHNADLVDRAYEEGTLAKRDYSHLQENFEKMVESIHEQRPIKPGGLKTVSEAPCGEKIAVGVSVSPSIKTVKSEDGAVTLEQLERLQSNLSLRLNNEDAPVCTTCGDVMTRNGSCYKCLGCGETSGCS
ncbi:MAG: adenosylcobalamin-dependent ribonucleoside-diphosphate reductase [Candidatus Gracilibacteria bacterium]